MEITGMQIAGAYIYPIKSCGGVSLQKMQISERGPSLDRQWMLIDLDGKMITQRQVPAMAKIGVRLVPGKGANVARSADADTANTVSLEAGGPKASHGLVNSNRQIGAIKIQIENWVSSEILNLATASSDFSSRVQKEAVVWSDTTLAIDEGDLIANAVSEFIGRPCRLVQLHPTFQRKLNPKYGFELAHTGFADGFPLLLATEESLLELNLRLRQKNEMPVTMDRFRANLVVRQMSDMLDGATAAVFAVENRASGKIADGAANLNETIQRLAFQEENWVQIKAGEVTFQNVKPCSRCQIINTDQNLGQVLGPEPLKTLASYRRIESRVNFGVNLVHLNEGLIQIGDSVQVNGTAKELI